MNINYEVTVEGQIRDGSDSAHVEITAYGIHLIEFNYHLHFDNKEEMENAFVGAYRMLDRREKDITLMRTLLENVNVILSSDGFPKFTRKIDLKGNQ